jgi:hypothetical protein
MDAQVEFSLSEWCKDFFSPSLVRIEGKETDHSITEVLIQGEVLFLRGKKSLLRGEDLFDKKSVSPQMTQEQTILISSHYVQSF